MTIHFERIFEDLCAQIERWVTAGADVAALPADAEHASYADGSLRYVRMSTRWNTGQAGYSWYRLDYDPE